jgi:hypothetical protein
MILSILNYLCVSLSKLKIIIVLHLCLAWSIVSVLYALYYSSLPEVFRNITLNIRSNSNSTRIISIFNSNSRS